MGEGEEERGRGCLPTLWEGDEGERWLAGEPQIGSGDTDRPEDTPRHHDRHHDKAGPHAGVIPQTDLLEEHRHTRTRHPDHAETEGEKNDCEKGDCER